MIYLYGAGGHAKVIIEILEMQQKAIAGLIDNDLRVEKIFHYPVFDQIPASATGGELIISIGDNHTRKELAEQQTMGFGSAIHPSANVSARSDIGEGTVIMAAASVNTCAKIGKHAILNTNCSIDHDCILGDYVHISPNAALAGNVTIGEGTHVGIGACVIPGITIGKWAVIGAGAVVTNDIPDYALTVGNPARIIKYNSTK